MLKMRKEKKGMRMRRKIIKEKEKMRFLNKLQKDIDYVNFGYLKNRKKIKKMRGVINYFTTNIK